MSGSGAPVEDEVDGGGLRVGVVATRWHARVTDGLLASALSALHDAGVTEVTAVRVPGAFELPVVARELALGGHDAVICLGAVVRGGTPHFDYVCRSVTDGCTQVALDTGVAVGFGVLTCDTEEQALDRAGLTDSAEDKGREAALAALSTAVLLRDLRRTHSRAD